MNDLTALVRTLCTAKRIRMKELADKMDISPVTLSRNLAKGNPRSSTFTKLATALGVNAEDLEKMYNHPEDYEITHKRGGNIGDIMIVPKAFNASIQMHDENDLFMRNEVSAVYGYKGNLFYANTIQEAKEILNVLEMLTDSDNEQHEATMISLLLSKYGKKKED